MYSFSSYSKTPEDEELELFIEENLQTPSSQIMWCLWCEPIKDCCCFLFRGCKRKTYLLCRAMFCCGESKSTKNLRDTTSMDISLTSAMSATEPSLRDDVENGVVRSDYSAVKTGKVYYTSGFSSEDISGEKSSSKATKTSKYGRSASSKAAAYLEKKRTGGSGSSSGASTASL